MQMYENLIACDQQSAVDVDIPLEVAVTTATAMMTTTSEKNMTTNSIPEEPQVLHSSNSSIDVCEEEEEEEEVREELKEEEDEIEHHPVEEEILTPSLPLPSTALASPSASLSDNVSTAMQMDEMLDGCSSIPQSTEVENGNEDITSEEMEIILSLLPKEVVEEEEVKTSNELLSPTEQASSPSSALATSILLDPHPVNEMQEEVPKEEHVEGQSPIEESHSRLVVYHKMVFSDSESYSGQCSPEHCQVPSQPRASHFDNQVRRELGSVASTPSQSESEILNPTAMNGLSVNECSASSSPSVTSSTQMENTQMPTHSSPILHLSDSTSTSAFPLSTPPRSTVKRFASDHFAVIQNDSPVCSPSKVIATALPVLPENPNSAYTEHQDHLSNSSISAASSSQLKSIERSPTKVVMEEDERQLSPIPTDNSVLDPFPSTPYSSSHFAPLTEVGQPLSVRLRRLLTQQADERSRFQQLLCCQTKGLYTSFLTDRQYCKVGMEYL